MPDTQTLQRMAARFAPTEISADLSKLSDTDRRVLAKLVEASKIVDGLFLRQAWAGNDAMLRGSGARSVARRARAPALLPDQQGTVVAPRPQRGRSCRARRRSRPAPTTIRKAPRRRTSSAGFSRCRKPSGPARPASSRSIRRAGNSFTLVPYNVEYQGELARAAALLRDAAQLTKRADAQGLSDQARRRVPVQRLLRERRRVDGAGGRDRADHRARTRSTRTSSSTTRPGSRRTSRCRIRSRPRSCRSSPRELQDIEDHLPIDPKQRNPQARRAGADHRRQRDLRVGRRQPRRPDRGVQPAERRARRARKGHQARDAEERAGREVRQDAAADLEDRPAAGRSERAVVRRLLHAHRRARADARPRAAQHHRQRPADDGAAGAEGDLQRARGGEGRHLGPVRDPAHDRQGRDAEVARAVALHDVSRVGVPIDPLRRERGARQAASRSS